MGEGSSPEIVKIVRKEGKYGRKPSLGWKCLAKVKVEGGELPFDVRSDYLSTDTAQITMGMGDWPVDKAIESCLETMHLHEESEFSFNVTDSVVTKIVISLEEAVEKDYVFDWPEEEKFEASKSYKSDGVKLFHEKRIDQAFHKFSKALKMLLLMECDLKEGECHPDGTELLISLYNNLANCQFHYKNYSHVTELSSRSLSVKPNVKGYFRRALAYIELKEYENAENDLLELLKIEPKNKAAIEKYKLVRELDKDNRENYENIVRNMFR